MRKLVGPHVPSLWQSEGDGGFWAAEQCSADVLIRNGFDWL